MVMMILEKVPVSLRGELSIWMLEPKAGVFVGTISALVREKLWEKVCMKAGLGGCTLVYSFNNEQGFKIEQYGETNREVIDIEGLQLIKIR